MLFPQFILCQKQHAQCAIPFFQQQTECQLFGFRQICQILVGLKMGEIPVQILVKFLQQRMLGVCHQHPDRSCQENMVNRQTAQLLPIPFKQSMFYPEWFNYTFPYFINVFFL